MTELSFETALDARVGEMLDACTMRQMRRSLPERGNRRTC
jgi:hypothetical protein